MPAILILNITLSMSGARVTSPFVQRQLLLQAYVGVLPSVTLYDGTNSIQCSRFWLRPMVVAFYHINFYHLLPPINLMMHGHLWPTSAASCR